MGSIIFLLLAVTEIFMAVWKLTKKDDDATRKSMVRITEFILLAIFLLTGILEWGFRYYIIALVLFFQALLGTVKLLQKNRKERPFRMGRTIGSCAGKIFGYFMALVIAILFPQFAPLEMDGEMTVAYDKYTWTDETRSETFVAVAAGETRPKRKLTVEFWYPEEKNDAAEATYPLVVFSHGASGFSGSNLSTFNQLASHGYVVASIGHTYHALYTLDTDQTLTPIDRDFINEVTAVDALADGEEKYNLTQSWLQLRVADENFVLDTILKLAEEGEVGPFNQIDTAKIGLFGHSLGGAASAALGRTRRDIDAVIDIDGSMLGEVVAFQDGQKILNDEPYPVPLLNLYAADHYLAARKELEENPGREYYNFHATENAIKAYEVVLRDAGHLNFSDLPLFSPVLAKLMGSGTVDARYGIETMNKVVLEFFDSVLKQGTEPDIEKEY